MRNWAGNVTFSARELLAPRSVDELQELVARSVSIRALGTAHSFNRIADSRGTLVSTSALGLTIEIDEERGVAAVPGGMTYADVADVLQAAGWALPNMGSLPHISVAGACATGTHGSGVTNGCLATAVVGIETVTADGTLRQVHAGEADFDGMVVSLGCLGIVTRLWLTVEPTYDVSQEVLLDVPVRTAVDRAVELLSSAYSVSIFSSFRDPAALDSVWRKHRLAASGERQQVAGSDSTWGGRLATEDVHPLLGLDAGAATQQRGIPGPWHRRLPHFRAEFTPSVGDELQSEYFLPRSRAGEALEALVAASARFATPLQVFEMRTIAADSMWISPFHHRDTVAVHATWVSDWTTVRPALGALEEAIAPYEPRPHWGKVFLDHDAARLASAYPDLPRFRELVQRSDPGRKFANDFLVGLGVL